MKKTSKTNLSVQKQSSPSILPLDLPSSEQTNQGICAKFEPLVASLARSFSFGYGNFNDLQQEGFLGLLEAVRHFDPDRGVKLSTFAYQYVRGRILNFLRGERQHYLAPESESEYDGRRYFYLSESITKNDSDPDDGLTLEEMIPSVANGALEEMVDVVLLRGKIESALLVLTNREKEVMTLYYWEDLLPSEIAQKIGVSRPRVTKLLQRSLEKLRLQMRFN
jgi:RNA polymerase sporulation-specific sigma factor